MKEINNNTQKQKSPLEDLGVQNNKIADPKNTPSGGWGVNNNTVVTKNPPFRGLGGN
jgi:hypothetical protein